jgi:hypothetical protein
MLIEAMTPLTVKFSTGDIQLTPGVPVEIPTMQAQRLLAKAPGKVREVTRGWLPAWRELAALTSGLTADDPRLPVVMVALNECDNTYLNGDWTAFRQAAARVRSAMAGRNSHEQA